ncbi:XdhC family protein [Paenibacillus sp. DXFW5]|uniref:XdhC family protein n=1 Tax=Paenibacillus rhizolycopersici TaxID=2780073 RepID=A0ABS2HCY3_9BACL|nr:XdhC family protein [Paenibacillus rhizolycopersici]MBM6997740.1 XdhC family protein [Paenibacillus rhizolycopersici]
MKKAGSEGEQRTRTKTGDDENMEELSRELKACLSESRACVVATIVDVDGSAYRREGARCLIHVDGEVTGILSGGCIEEDLREHAQEVLRTLEPRKLFYDFRIGEDEVWGIGLGCNGAITVWLEPFDPVRSPHAADRILGDLRRRVETREPYVVATVIGSSDPAAVPPGARRTLAAAAEEAGLLGAGRRAGLVRLPEGSTQLELLLERVAPRPELVIVGVGDDARLLCSLARRLQWRVTVAYHATDKATRERFPAADELRVIPRYAFEQVDVKGKYVVVMSHNLDLDREAVHRMLTPEVAYLGLVGSRYRLEKILEPNSNGGGSDGSIDPQLLAKLYSPVGLDIGAETPEEIAMSILAEMTAVKNGRSGGFLRDRKAAGSGARTPTATPSQSSFLDEPIFPESCRV